MRVLLRALLAGALALSLTACMGSRHYAGPGRYMVQGPGFNIVSGPYPDAGSCHKAIPQKQHSQAYVCMFMREDVRPNIWKKTTPEKTAPERPTPEKPAPEKAAPAPANPA